MEEVCDERVQKSSAYCNSDNIERVRNNSTGRKRLERISENRRVDKAKSPRLHLFKESCISEPPQMCDAYYIQGRTTPLYRASNWGRLKKCCKRLRTPNLLEACLEREIM